MEILRLHIFGAAAFQNACIIMQSSPDESVYSSSVSLSSSSCFCSSSYSYFFHSYYFIFIIYLHLLQIGVTRVRPGLIGPHLSLMYLVLPYISQDLPGKRASAICIYLYNYITYI